MMKDFSRIALLFISIVAVMMVWRGCNTDKQIDLAIDAMDKAKTELQAARDSLRVAQITIDSALVRLAVAETQLEIMAVQSHMMDIEARIRKAINTNELQMLNTELLQMQSLRDSLKQVALGFEH